MYRIYWIELGGMQKLTVQNCLLARGVGVGVNTTIILLLNSQLSTPIHTMMVLSEVYLFRWVPIYKIFCRIVMLTE